MQNSHVPKLCLFYRDLRLHDNTALSAMLAQHDTQAHALYVITPEQWLEHDTSLVQVDLILRTLPILADSLSHQWGIILTVLLAKDFTESIEVISQFCQEHQIKQVFANHEYELNEVRRDEQLAKQLTTLGVGLNLYHDQCILPPNSVQNNDGQMYRVFTPFYKKWLRQLEMSPPVLHELHELHKLHELPTSVAQPNTTSKQPSSDNTYQQNLKPHSARKPKQSSEKGSAKHLENNLENVQTLCQKVASEYKSAWQAKTARFNKMSNEQIDNLLTTARQNFPAGENNACHRLDQFIAEDIDQYDMARDVPSLQATSSLSPYLAIGSLSPRLCYLQATKALSAINHANERANNASKDIYRWISELAWRDFYRHVLVDRPDLSKHQAYLIDTDSKVEWSYDTDSFVKWCEGKTGVPLVDSAMRCLNTTGFMHNRLRMVVAMFLTKDLLIDWRWGERYFMQRLIDADFASNNGGWQWSASTGTDSAPYFRIMNPFSQGKTHDSDALFIKTWLPELKDVPAKILHDEKKLSQFLTNDLLIDYPLPMIDHKLARLRAIEVFKNG